MSVLLEAAVSCAAKYSVVAFAGPLASLRRLACAMNCMVAREDGYAPSQPLSVGELYSPFSQLESISDQSFTNNDQRERIYLNEWLPHLYSVWPGSSKARPYRKGT